MSNQRLSVNQLLRATPNCWPTNFFLCFSSWAFHEPLVCMMEKVLFHYFQMFFIVFNHANACASMHLLVEIHNIQSFKYRMIQSLKFLQDDSKLQISTGWFRTSFFYRTIQSFKFIQFDSKLKIWLEINCVAAGFSISEPPGGHFYSMNRISWIWFPPGLIWCGIGNWVGVQ